MATCALAAATIASAASAQQLFVKRYGLDDGLPAAQVFAAHQDATG